MTSKGYTVAFVSTMDGCPWGGSEELWSQAAGRLIQQGVSVAVNVPWWPQPVSQVEQLGKAGCVVKRRSSPDRRLLAKVSRRLGFTKSQLSWLDETRPKLVIISQGHHTAGLEWMQACAERHIAYAIIVQAASEFWWPSDDILIPLSQAFEAAKACFFVSEGNLRLVERQFARGLPNACVVRNPFNVSYLAHLEWPAEPTYRLACVARLEPAPKGQDILLEVLAKDKWRQRPISVSFIGNGANGDSLHALQKKLAVECVRFEGFVPNIEAVWADHHMLILPSRYEGLPLALVEAMLCGRPSIVTDVAGNAELVQDNRNGFVAGAPTTGYLDEAMERAWQRRGCWEKMGQAATERVRELVPPDPVSAFVEKLQRLI